MTMKSRFRNFGLRLSVIAAGLFVLTGVTQLRAQGTTATIVGAITDTSGAAVPNTAVQAKNTGTGAINTVQSDNQGRYTVPDLQVGNYDIQATKEGFQTVVRKGVELTVGGQPVVDFSLPVGQTQQTVTVEAEVTQVETTTSTLSSLVDQKQMEDLPLNGRNFESLILLAPGVQYFYAVVTSGAQGRSMSYSVSGSRPSGQALLLDDENMQTFWNRGLASITGSSLGIEAIGEFQTLTNTYSAQFGGNGAAVNSVSKAGSNNFHGSAYEYLRNSAMDARRFFDPKNLPPFRRNQYGGSLGGPVKRNKMFFFVNYEGIKQLLGESAIASVPACNLVPTACTITATNAATAQAVAGVLALYPAATTLVGNGIGTTTQVANQIARENYILGRFDYNISDKDAIFVRYLSDDAHFLEPFANTGGSQAIALWPDNDASHNQFATVEWRRIVSPTIVNIARASFSRPAANESPSPTHSALQFFPGSGRVDGEIGVSGLTTLGPNLFNPFVLNQNKFTEADDVIWTKGAHSVRFGMSVVRFQTNSALQQFAGINWTFTSLTNLLAGKDLRDVGTPLGSQYYGHFDLREIDLTPYIQDDWKISPKLTLNLGLRWEFQTNPVSPHNTTYMVTNFAHGTGFDNVPHIMATNPSWGNLEPRIGVAFDPFGDHKTSVRAGFGIFHDLITPGVYWPALTGQPPWVNYSQVGAPFPTPFTTLVAPTPAVAPGWDYYTNTTPYMIQYNFTIQREIAPATVLSVGYVGAKGVHLFNGTEQNPTQATIDSNRVYHFDTLVNGSIVPNPRLNPNFSYLADNMPAAYSNYNSLQAALNRRFANNFQVQASYTWSRCMDNGGSVLGALTSNTSGSASNPYDRHIDYGPCAQDIRQTLRVNGMYALPFHGNRVVDGWQLSGIVASATGLPFNIANGFDYLGNNSNVRPNYVSGCKLLTRRVNQWFNDSCLAVAPVGTIGNLGRDVGRGPGYQDTDVSLLKDTAIREALHLQFRAEVFNIFNHTNFGLPVSNAFSAGVAGQCTASGAGCAVQNAQAGRITSIIGTPRQFQLSLKLIF